MPQLSKRTETFTDSVIRRMTRISLKYGAVNLSQGFPDFEPPKEILNRLAEVSREDFHQYSITWGAQNFREALAEKQSRLMGRKNDYLPCLSLFIQYPLEQSDVALIQPGPRFIHYYHVRIVQEADYKLYLLLISL